MDSVLNFPPSEIFDPSEVNSLMTIGEFKVFPDKGILAELYAPPSEQWK